MSFGIISKPLIKTTTRRAPRMLVCGNAYRKWSVILMLIQLSSPLVLFLVTVSKFYTDLLLLPLPTTVFNVDGRL